MKIISVVKTAIIASLYAALVILLTPISFYAFQIRIADALLLLPFLEFFGLPAVTGLTIGCAIANTLSPFGIIDIIFGSLANFLAGLTAWVIGKKSKNMYALVLAAVVETLIISAIVGYIILHLVGGLDLVVAFVGVLVGSIVSVCVLGITLILFLMKGLKIF
ncbi:MAG: QueT transporter family protein [Ignisphaera sp.]